MRFRPKLIRYHVSSTQLNHLLSSKQQLYMTHELSPGSIFFLPHGTRIFNKLVQFMKNQQIKYGFQEVITPLIYKNKLWEQSGHWENYKDDMYKVIGNDLAREQTTNLVETHDNHQHDHQHHDNSEVHDHSEDHENLHEYGLKPMNCPGHCLIFSKFERSYNELPVRLSDFSSLHRNEASGALTGLTRVRRFHQDDGHIFCEMNQIKTEILNTINLITDTYKIFNIDKNIKYNLSTRPDNFMGDIESWDLAEQELKSVLNEKCGDDWEVKEKDGAFYGPKIDIMVTDHFEKTHQIGTIQLDFQLPSRFNLKYIDSEGGRNNRPIMVHRAVFGSLERFFAILLDNYQGNWPFWLNPRQAIIVPVNESHINFCDKLSKQLSGDIVNAEISPITGYNFYIDVDRRAETVGNRIKEAISKGYSYILTVGDKDIANGTVAIRSRESRKVENLKVEEIYQKFITLEKQYK